jgi:glycerol-3-phosphate acyltransferase PlsX
MGPAEVAAGAAMAAGDGIRVLLFGPASEMGEVAEGVEVVDSPISISKAAEPAAAVRSTPEASIVRAWRAVSAGDAQALVSGGSTGAALAAGLFNVKRAKGIYRPALALPLPVPGHPVTLLDVGANTEVRSEHLVQFAFMGAAFMSTVLGVDKPRVALLSNGEEETKGTPLVLETHRILAESGTLNFIGNVEGRHITNGEVDVVVTDGFTGNIALKLIEAVSEATVDIVDTAIKSNARSRLAGRLLAPAIREAEEAIDPEGAGGAYLLGLRHLGVVPHGRFTRYGVSQAIMLAARGVREDVIERTHAELEAGHALRPSRDRPSSDAAATVPSRT